MINDIVDEESEQDLLRRHQKKMRYALGGGAAGTRWSRADHATSSESITIFDHLPKLASQSSLKNLNSNHNRSTDNVKGSYES